MGKKWKQVRDFIFCVYKITADGDCSYEIKKEKKKKLLLLGRKVMTNLDNLLKSRGLSSQSYGLSSSHVWM